MKKQKLKLEDLELESFSTIDAGDPNTAKGGLITITLNKQCVKGASLLLSGWWCCPEQCTCEGCPV